MFEQPNAGAEGASQGAAPGMTFVGGFAPASLEQQAEEAVQAMGEKEEGQSPTTEEPKVEEKKEPLAELIRRQREERQAREAEAKKAKDAEAKVAEFQAEVEKLKRSSSEFEADPVAYARAAGWTKEKQAYIGQMLLYDLAPDKATPDVRQRLFESRQALKEREAEAKRQREAQEAKSHADKAEYQNFVTTVDQAVESFESGSYPESEAWFHEDRDTYKRSLVATAMNLAKTAAAAGKMADLSPANLARVLEADIARRMAARDQRRGVRQSGSSPGQQRAQEAGGKQPTDSTKGMTGAGKPRPKAETEKERIQRAIEAGWGTR